jgi:2-hydroxy-3-oxopropionate reductase
MVPSWVVRKSLRPGFKTKLHCRDLRIARAAGAEHGVPLPVTDSIREMACDLKVSVRGEYDHSGIIAVLEDLANAEVKK